MVYRSIFFRNTVRVFSFILISLAFASFSQAALLELKFSADRLVIKADDVDLKEILQAISLETGMLVSYLTSETTEVISCTIDEPSMASSLSSLLKNWNYSLVFGENQGGASVPRSLWLVGKISNKPHSGNNQKSIEGTSQPDDHMGHFQKNVFVGLFKEEHILAKQMEIKIPKNSLNQVNDSSLHLLPGQRGIQITSLTPNSSYEKIGLHAGDIIYDVNGTSINSAKDFVKAMKVSSGQSIVRIERYLADQTIDPIYIELH